MRRLEAARKLAASFILGVMTVSGTFLKSRDACCSVANRGKADFANIPPKLENDPKATCAG
jgi:hypothetical protein